MVETGFNQPEIGKIILAACFVNDLLTVLALGLIFANYNLWLVAFAGTTVITLWLLPRHGRWFFLKIGTRGSEPQIKFVLLILFLLGGLGNSAMLEAVLADYLSVIVPSPVLR